MHTLAETIDDALAHIGREIEFQLNDAMDGFNNLALADEEQVAALATTIAALALRYHKRHTATYLEAIRIWSVEIAETSRAEATELRCIPDPASIEDSAAKLVAGLTAVIDELRIRNLEIRDRLITELAAVARLLGQHDPYTIENTLMAVSRALADSNFRPGDLIMVPVRETPFGLQPLLGLERTVPFRPH